jgi:hypothetical protein
VAEITHKALVKRASLWLRNSQSYTVVLSELSTNAGEVPDVIGFRSCDGNSLLIECKASRADFLSDKKKYFRQNPYMGMGSLRYMFAIRGLIKPEELPEGWGLLEGTANRIYVVKKSEVFGEVSKRNEVIMLTSVLRRLEISTAVFVRHDNSLNSEVS